MNQIHANIKVNGIVQGVGFRPFIHLLAQKNRLYGWIRNTSSGAEIDVEGEKENIYSFISDIRYRHPALAEIGSIDTVFSENLSGYDSFEIIESQADGDMDTLISPDIGICDDCRKELSDPKNRRYRYPFINCTNCGPRFTIIKDTPYDRKNTTMAAFEMCDKCSAEYHDITNRRYHAQPDCCKECGPELEFLDAEGSPVAGDPLENAIKALKNGKIIAIKGLGGFHLACRCDDSETARILRERKHRDERPLAIMCKDQDTAKRFAYISADEGKHLDSYKKPIVLLKKKNRTDYPWLSENGYIGIMLPYTPLHCLLLDAMGSLIMTSANLSDSPIIYRNDEAICKLKGIADAFLLHDREIETRCDDSLLWLVKGQEYLVRRSRGYVPYPVRLDFETVSDGILACGAEQKASFALSKGKLIFPAQHIGDLKTLEAVENYEGQILHFEKMFHIPVKQIVCDMHPDYGSTAYALRRAESEHLPLLQVQHHHAHMASCMADNGLTDRCIGIIWDGTGYGTDGQIWGGEFLTGDLDSFERAGTIRALKLAGGDTAVKEIWRCAVAALEDAGIDSSLYFTGSKADAVRKMLRHNINCPEVHSMGRLFDAVSAILGFKTEVSYEGQGAVLLEAAAAETDETYQYDITYDKRYEFDTRLLIHCIIISTIRGEDKGLIAARFMNTLVCMAADMCERIREDTGLNCVVMSGGSFQNMYILKRLTDLLKSKGFKTYRHRRVSTNDEGISFGQAAIAAWKGRK